MTKVPVTTDEKCAEFERQIFEIAEIFAGCKKYEGDFRPPHAIINDLKIVDKALTAALQKLVSLKLKHQEGQDISKFPFNWPVVQSLSHARLANIVLRGDPIPEHIPTYPTELIQEIRELRDAARKAIQLEKPKRGNSALRNPTSARQAGLAKNFVFCFRCCFCYMPPISKSGWVVDLLSLMFQKAGEESNDVAVQLRCAIKNDKAGRQLLGSKPSNKGAK